TAARKRRFDRRHGQKFQLRSRTRTRSRSYDPAPARRSRAAEASRASAGPRGRPRWAHRSDSPPGCPCIPQRPRRPRRGSWLYIASSQSSLGLEGCVDREVELTARRIRRYVLESAQGLVAEVRYFRIETRVLGPGREITSAQIDPRG